MLGHLSQYRHFCCEITFEKHECRDFADYPKTSTRQTPHGYWASDKSDLYIYLSKSIFIYIGVFIYVCILCLSSFQGLACTFWETDRYMGQLCPSCCEITQPCGFAGRDN